MVQLPTLCLHWLFEWFREQLVPSNLWNVICSRIKTPLKDDLIQYMRKSTRGWSFTVHTCPISTKFSMIYAVCQLVIWFIISTFLINSVRILIPMKDNSRLSSTMHSLCIRYDLNRSVKEVNKYDLPSNMNSSFAWLSNQTKEFVPIRGYDCRNPHMNWTPGPLNSILISTENAVPNGVEEKFRYVTSILSAPRTQRDCYQSLGSLYNHGLHVPTRWV